MHRFDAAFNRRLTDNLHRFERRALDAETKGHRRAAVAIAVMPGQESTHPLDACFVLTVRSAGLNRHSYQFALPGGRIDPGETAEEAALRELSEEVGLELGAERVLGLLDDYPTRSGFLITPVVVWGDPDQRLVKNPGEVAEVFRVPVDELLAPEVPILESIEESDRPVLSVRLMGWQVFAPTAAILYQFAAVAVEGGAVRVADYDEPVFAWS